jgi:hypothetical protein
MLAFGQRMSHSPPDQVRALIQRAKLLIEQSQEVRRRSEALLKQDRERGVGVTPDDDDDQPATKSTADE